MKISELRLEAVNYPFSTRELSPREHYTVAMKMGHGFPTTQPQAAFMVKCVNIGNYLLNAVDVGKIESILNEAGFEGDYKPTKAGHWVRLQNTNDFRRALAVKFKIKPA